MSEQDIPLSRPDISDLEVEMVSLMLRSGRLVLGQMVERQEGDGLAAIRAPDRRRRLASTRSTPDRTDIEFE